MWGSMLWSAPTWKQIGKASGALLAVGGFLIAFASTASDRSWILFGFAALLGALVVLRVGAGWPRLVGAGLLAVVGLVTWTVPLVQTISASFDKPSVSVVPVLGDHTTLFHGAGHGFSSSGAVTVTAVMPNGDPYGHSYSKTADAKGNLEWTWSWDPGDPDGRWTIQFLDHVSGDSTSVHITIVARLRSDSTPTNRATDTPPGQDQPTVTVSPASGDHSTLFAGTARGFTPDASIKITAITPAGAPYHATYEKTADSSGAFTWSWQWDPGDPDGTWTIEFVDQQSRQTASVKLVIRDGPTVGNRVGTDPLVSVTPQSGGHSTLFHGRGSGFTPDGAVTVSAVTPTGTAYKSTYPKTADSAGELTWTWRWDPGDPDGTWTIKFTDESSGKTTSIALGIRGTTASPVGSRPTPAASVTPASGDHSTLFQGKGWGFTPGGDVTVSAVMPNGQPYTSTYPKTADSAGRFTWTWRWDPGDPDGTWTIRFKDAHSKQSTSIRLTIRGTSVSPGVSVSPAAGDHSTLFQGMGWGFTPDGDVTVSAVMPNGQPYKSTYPKTADSAGKFTWSWRWDPGDPDGTWTIKFKDLTSGKTTSVKLSITP